MHRSRVRPCQLAGSIDARILSEARPLDFSGPERKRRLTEILIAIHPQNVRLCYTGQEECRSKQHHLTRDGKNAKKLVDFGGFQKVIDYVHIENFTTNLRRCLLVFELFQTAA